MDHETARRKTLRMWWRQNQDILDARHLQYDALVRTRYRKFLLRRGLPIEALRGLSTRKLLLRACIAMVRR